MKGSICQKHLSESKIHPMAQSTWMCNLQKRSITTVLLTKSWLGLSSLQINLKLKVIISKDKKSELLKSLTNDWKSASEIADIAEIQHRSAIKILISMALNGECESKTFEWVDSKLRKRKCMLYRVPKMSVSEQAALLNSVFMNMIGIRND